MSKLVSETQPPASDAGAPSPGVRFNLGETTRQTGMLFSAQTASMLAGFFASIILGRWMEPGEMGRFAFCLSIIVVTGLLFEFGISSAGARVLALTRDREGEREALGALVLITLAVSVAFGVFIAAAAKPIDLIFDKDVRWLFMATAALAFFQPFQLFIEQSCQGLNQIRRLSVFQMTMSGCYLVALIVLVASHRLTAGTALGAYLGGIGIAAIWTLIRMQPSFKGASRYITLTLKETRGYGFNLYLARISGVATSRSDQLAIGYFLQGTAPLGMYAIAQKFSNPIAMMSRSLATTRFRAFARLTRVPSRITRWNAAAVIGASVALIVLGPIVLRFVFPKYSEAAPLLVPFAAMNLFVGLFQPYNIFLAAHGRGAELRNIVLISGTTAIIALVFAVPRFGITGAAWTGASAMALDYVLHLLYYRRYIQTERESSPHATEIRNEGAPRALLLDLSGDENAAMEWAAGLLPGALIRPLNKAELKWASRRDALTRVRSLTPDIFCVFASDLRTQSGQSALMLFAIFAGARRVILGDRRGRTTSRSQLGVLLIEAPRFALELLAGYGLIVPLSWLLTEALGLSLAFRGLVRASRNARTVSEPERKRSMSALYVRATLTSAAQGGMPTHVAGFASGAAALGHRLKFLLSGARNGEDDAVVIPPSQLFSATKALFELWNNLVFTSKSLLLDAVPVREIDFIYQRYSRFNWTGALLSALTGLPLALEFNGSEVWISLRWDPSGLLWLLKRFERVNLRAADLIFVVSAVERRNLIEAGVNPAKIIVNPNGVDTERFRPNCGGREIRSAIDVEDQIVIGFVGTFGPWHGAPTLAEAAKRINDPEHRCHFVFIGSGEQRAQTESIIEAASVSATFTGSISHERVPAYLDACDILASPHAPSTDGTEFFGSPTKLFEYLAMGKGIVASRLGQVGEVIIDGENGLLAGPGDADSLARAIERLAADVELRARLGAAARETAIERYTWRHNAARVFEAIAAFLK